MRAAVTPVRPTREGNDMSPRSAPETSRSADCTLITVDDLGEWCCHDANTETARSRAFDDVDVSETHFIFDLPAQPSIGLYGGAVDPCRPLEIHLGRAVFADHLSLHRARIDA